MAASLIFALFLPAAPAARAAEPTSQGLTLLQYRITPQSEALLGDMLKVSFTLKNTSQAPVRLDSGTGVFMGVRWIGSGGKKRNRDFGYQHKGAVIEPGQSLAVQAEKVLDTQGTWRVFPACRVEGKWADFDRVRVSISVTEKKRQVQAGKGGGGATVVPWQGRKLPIQVFPPDNPWNQNISRLPKHPDSDAFLKSMGLDRKLHPDFGTRRPLEQPSAPRHTISGRVSERASPWFPVKFRWAGESDPGPYPIPPDFKVEKGGDRHIVVLDYDAKKLYEVFLADKDGQGWKGGAGAVFDLASNRHRPVGWTSADAAGLPIFPGLVRLEEIETLGEIPHALRFTVKRTQKGYIKPASHFASKKTDPGLPPMGLRVRLRADFDTSEFPHQAKVILECLKKYGMILADNGGNWYISGAPSARWDNNQLAFLKKVKGRDLEVVYTGEIMH